MPAVHLAAAPPHAKGSRTARLISPASFLSPARTHIHARVRARARAHGPHCTHARPHRPRIFFLMSSSVSRPRCFCWSLSCQATHPGAHAHRERVQPVSGGGSAGQRRQTKQRVHIRQHATVTSPQHRVRVRLRLKAAQQVCTAPRARRVLDPCPYCPPLPPRAVASGRA